MPLLSIIMPVYNASETIQMSLQSIICQDFKDYELVIVDDCSTDNSLELIDSVLKGKDVSFKIVRQESNCGVAASRNRGLSIAMGDYLCFVDADDTMAPNALNVIVEAIKKGADMIGWDWTLCFKKRFRYMTQKGYKTPEEALRNLFCGVMRWNLWLFSYKRRMLQDNGIAFLNGENMGEDMQFTIKAFSVSETVVQIHEALYNYNAVNDGSVSRTLSMERRLEVAANLAEIEHFLGNIDEKTEEWLNFLKLNIKLPLLVSNNKADYYVWKGWMPEANSFSLRNNLLPLRTRILQWFASKGLWLFVRLYYELVYRFVYGVLYK